jgi:hypothetical protein
MVLVCTGEDLRLMYFGMARSRIGATLRRPSGARESAATPRAGGAGSRDLRIHSRSE